MIAPCWNDNERVAQLRDRWARAGTVRCEPFLPEAAAIHCLRALRAADYRADHRFDAGQAYQLWRYGWRPCETCDAHPLCRLAHGLYDKGTAFISAITGRQLHIRPDDLFVADMTRKGSFFEAYDDAALGASVALQLHFTTASWPDDWGGHVERATEEASPERWTPAWNAIDMIDLERGSTMRRMELTTRHVEGFTVSAWLFRNA